MCPLSIFCAYFTKTIFHLLLVAQLQVDGSDVETTEIECHSDTGRQDNVSVAEDGSRKRRIKDGQKSVEEGDGDGDFDPDQLYQQEGTIDGWSDEDGNSSAHEVHDGDVPDSDSDDSLVAYDLADDEEDLRKVPLPTYVHHCLEYFRKPDDRDKVEAGLEALERLIRNRPDGLEETALSLLRSLIQIGTTGWIDEEDWECRRLGSMVALVCTVPTTVVPYLSRQFYADNRSVKDRLDCLDVLLAAVQELSCLHKTGSEPEGQSAPQLAFSNLSIDQSKELTRAQEAHAIVRRRVEQKTRRWGVKRGPDKTEGENRFGALAGLFFYSLISEANKAVGSLHVFSQETVLLARLLHVLAIFVKASGRFPNTRQLARSLMDLVITTRYHDDAAVRRSSLFALLQILAVLPPYVVISDFGQELEEIIQWLVEVKTAEPDQESRQLALLCLLAIKDALGETPMFMNSSLPMPNTDGDVSVGGLSLKIPSLASNGGILPGW